MSAGVAAGPTDRETEETGPSTLLDTVLSSGLLDPRSGSFVFLLAVGATVGVVVLAHALLTVLGL
jgi:hypothetical protein